MKWFYVQNILPPENTRVLVAMDDAARWVEIATRNGNHWEDDFDTEVEQSVIAWAFLLPHPKEIDDHENYSSKGNPLPPSPLCYRCEGRGYITYFGVGADEGHDMDVNCPVCNPKYSDYD